MKTLDRPFLVLGLTHAIVGLGMGIYMASSKDTSQVVTHVHVLLVGFLVSVIYALIHRLWLNHPARWIALLQFTAHQLGAVVMVIGLFLHYGGYFPHETLEPWLAGSSLSVLLAMILMTVMVLMPGSRHHS